MVVIFDCKIESFSRIAIPIQPIHGVISVIFYNLCAKRITQELGLVRCRTWASMKETIKKMNIKEMSFTERGTGFTAELDKLMKKWFVTLKPNPVILEGKIEAEIKVFDILSK